MGSRPQSTQGIDDKMAQCSWHGIGYTHSHTTLQHRVRGTVGLLHSIVSLIARRIWVLSKSSNQYVVAFFPKVRDVGAERLIPFLSELYEFVNPPLAHYPAPCLPGRGVYAVRLATAVLAKISKRSQDKQTSTIIRHPIISLTPTHHRPLHQQPCLVALSTSVIMAMVMLSLMTLR